jgi:large-conductance mechanosensitive channel
MSTFPDLTPIFTRPDTFALNFVQFLKEYNVIGLGIGALVASNTMDIGKSLVDSLIMPIVTGIVTQTAPTFTYYSLIQSIITFLVTMFVIFFLMSVFGVKATKPVTYVRVVKPDLDGSLSKFEGYMNMNGENNMAENAYENKNM